MITKRKSPKKAFIRQSMAIVVLIAAVFAFSAKSILAQEIKDKTQPVTKSSPKPKDSTMAPWVGVLAGGNKEGVSQKLLTEYQNIINRTKTSEMRWYDFRKNIPPSDRESLETIFKKMTRAQQQEQTVVFLQPDNPLPRVAPTEKQFKNFKNAKTYGVWVNDKKVANSVLSNYNAKDFAQIFISKLYGAAKKNVSYSYQVNMMTNDYYQAYYDRTIADKSNTMVFQSRKVAKE
jgi:hypothetical protein